MSVITLPAPAPPAAVPSKQRPDRSGSALDRYFCCLFDLTARPAPWDRNAVLGLFSLFLLWAARFYTTWATWGNLSVDSGREMYVPAMLAQGKMLYRDVWWGYTPLAPYLNSLLFRTFGVHLNVLYWAGSLAALTCAVLLFLSGRRLGSSLAGWTAGAILLMEAFHAWHFSFPLAYSFSAVYGCLTACLFLWMAVNACRSKTSRWMWATAAVAAAALLVKLEYGAACYGAYALVAVGRAWRDRSWKRLAMDSAACAPGVLVCILVAWWMVSIAGFEFITQENLASTWPGSFFMKNYGPAWLQRTGLAITVPALAESLARTLFLAGAILEAYLLFWRKQFSSRSIVLSVVLAACLLAYGLFVLEGKPLETLGAVFFPQDMVLYVAIAAVLVALHIVRNRRADSALPLAALFAFAVLVAIRTLLKTTAWGYSIYCNGPAVLAFLILVRPVVPRAGQPNRSIVRSELLLCLGSLAVVSMYAAKFAANYDDREPLVTERGTILASTQTTEQYRAAITLMKKESAAGRMVLVVPEDTSLYFLSGTEAPARLYFLTPGMLTPGKMTQEMLREIDHGQVRYILWSNRSFPDYGAPRFGTDFDQTLGNYLTTHYRDVGPLIPDADLEWQTRFEVWERKPDSPIR